jgi:hypothetical protein
VADLSGSAEHDMKMSGANSDGTYFQQCCCGWRSAPCPDPRAANVQLLEHAATFADR